MEEYKIEFKRTYKNTWMDMQVKYSDYSEARKAVIGMMKDDFYAKDYDYEYRIMKNGEQIDSVFKQWR